MRTVFFSALIVALVITTLVIPALAQGEAKPDPNPREQFDASYPEIPADLWADYMTALEKEEVFAFGQAMKTELVKKEMADFEGRSGLKAEIIERTFLSLCEGVRVYCGGETMRLSPARQGVADSILVRCEMMEKRSPKGAGAQYRIPDALLAPLRFMVVERIVLTHPVLSRRIESFTAENESLASIFNRVFEAANVNWKKDPNLAIAMGSDAMAGRVTVSVYGMTVLDILSIAADAAGSTLVTRPELTSYTFGSSTIAGPCYWNGVEVGKFMDERRALSYDDFSASFPAGSERVSPSLENPYPGMLREALAKVLRNIDAYKFRIRISTAAK